MRLDAVDLDLQVFATVTAAVAVTNNVIATVAATTIEHFLKIPKGGAY